MPPTEFFPQLLPMQAALWCSCCPEQAHSSPLTSTRTPNSNHGLMWPAHGHFPNLLSSSSPCSLARALAPLLFLQLAEHTAAVGLCAHGTPFVGRSVWPAPWFPLCLCPKLSLSERPASITIYLALFFFTAHMSPDRLIYLWSVSSH